MNLNEIAVRAFENAKAKGFYDKELSPLERHMLIVSEIAEATEEARKATPPVYWNTPTGVVTCQQAGGSFQLLVGETMQKPEGELIEMADAIIRICDYCAWKGWDLESAVKGKMEYNETRPYRHGGKKY